MQSSNTLVKTIVNCSSQVVWSNMNYVYNVARHLDIIFYFSAIYVNVLNSTLVCLRSQMFMQFKR